MIATPDPLLTLEARIKHLEASMQALVSRVEGVSEKMVEVLEKISI